MCSSHKTEKGAAEEVCRFFSDSLHGVEKYKARDQRARQTVDEGEVRQACKINHNCCFGGVSNNHILAIS